jgi:hypothetical protein
MNNYLKIKVSLAHPLQATGYIRATAPNSVTGDNKPNVI